ncbi:MAG: Glycosyltransferase [Parcubacteria group bacterium GW2011_GWA1_44_13]|uniref:Glycosyltransferase n=1 Tax=Candidatus Nomurabacteria bacterium GW2011_GWB1_44_12 TaxID=1618748 RepID=A0A837IBK5_9BACT|nr:MAG: Glycosyltransferase [Candidatus Nomurabacteria bacterium GW2011_GWD1_44_10]KKT37074.1 MAG: Glycosyltransferase [Candidatus Nomurabacteria bacterium GW2011_GWB1_44_12]KKT38370.1 MAG: Glycosyltransferase [Parcubacteria group bacterium GW2011_GWA1_44_13]
MKRILIFSLAYYPDVVAGAEVAIKEITDRTSGDDYVFDMVTLRFDSTLPKFERIGNVNVYRVGFATSSPNIADLSRFPLSVNKYFFPIWGFLKAQSLHKKNAYDGIWAMMANYAGFSALFFKIRNPNVRFLLTLQEGDPIEYIKHRMKFAFPLLQRVFARADFIQTISNYLAGFARNMGYVGPLEVVPNAVNVEHFAKEYSESELSILKHSLGKKPGDIFLITTSRMVAKNAVDEVIRALVFLPHNVKFLILGIGPDEEMLRNLAREKGVDDCVQFLGQVLHEDMPKYLKVSDIFIRPSRSEGLGNSFLEAMAAGIPVIATPVGGIPDFLFDPDKNPDHEPTGLFADINSPESIARQIKRLIDDPALRNRLFINGRTLVAEKYDWSLIAKAMKEKVFNGLFDFRV